MVASDPNWYAERAILARAMAYEALSPSARKSHLMMAEWYTRRSIEGGVTPVVVERG